MTFADSISNRPCLSGVVVNNGDYERPASRGPGTVGLSLIATVKRTFLYFMDHDPRTFVETVDFLGGEGLRPDGGGIEVIVTSLAVLGPVEDRSRIDLRSIHPDTTFDEVQARTSFALDVARSHPTESPSERELAALRAFPDGVTLAQQMLGRR